MIHEAMAAENMEYSVEFVNADSPSCRQSNASNGLSATSAGRFLKLAWQVTRQIPFHKRRSKLFVLAGKLGWLRPHSRRA